MGKSEATLEVDVQDDTGAAMLDQGAIQEVLLNLLGNALKYGGKSIILAVTAKGRVATIEVGDDGIGISEDDQKMIFEKFMQLENPLTRRYGATVRQLPEPGIAIAAPTGTQVCAVAAGTVIARVSEGHSREAAWGNVVAVEHAGGIVSFELVGGREEAWKLIDATRMLSITANLGDTKTTITHPASTTHGRLSREERVQAGIEEGLIRVAVGLEDVDDIRADLQRGLDRLS